jgi:phosphoserine phosphatase
MIVDGVSRASAIASADLPDAVGPATSAKGGFVFIATLIAPDGQALSNGDLTAASDAVAGDAPRWLDEGVAADVPFARGLATARATLEAALPQFDVIVQVEAERRRSLLIADMDSTMITVECIDELADYAGIRAQVTAVTEAAMRGELDFEGALRSRVALLKGLPESVIDECLRERVKIMSGAKALIRTLRANGGKAVLVSGGFTRFAEPVAAEIGFDSCRANVLGIKNGELDGTVIGDIVGALTKRDTLLTELAARHLPVSASQAIGDGANDIPMIEAAGLGVAYHAKPMTAAAADAQIRHGDLSALLYAMGYKRATWVAMD